MVQSLVAAPQAARTALRIADRTGRTALRSLEVPERLVTHRPPAVVMRQCPERSGSAWSPASSAMSTISRVNRLGNEVIPVAAGASL